jgi:hypothetical protein
LGRNGFAKAADLGAADRGRMVAPTVPDKVSTSAVCSSVNRQPNPGMAGVEGAVCVDGMDDPVSTIWISEAGSGLLTASLSARSGKIRLAPVVRLLTTPT